MTWRFALNEQLHATSLAGLVSFSADDQHLTLAIIDGVARQISVAGAEDLGFANNQIAYLGRPSLEGSLGVQLPIQLTNSAECDPSGRCTAVARLVTRCENRSAHRNRRIGRTARHLRGNGQHGSTVSAGVA